MNLDAFGGTDNDLDEQVQRGIDNRDGTGPPSEEERKMLLRKSHPELIKMGVTFREYVALTASQRRDWFHDQAEIAKILDT